MVGGGLRSVDDVWSLLSAGADGVLLNSAIAVVTDPGIIRASAEVFGVHCFCVALEAIRTSTGWEAMTDCGREYTNRDASAWSGEVVAEGAGQILLTAIDLGSTKSASIWTCSGRCLSAATSPS